MSLTNRLSRCLWQGVFLAGLLLLTSVGQGQAQSCTFTATDVVLGPVDVLGTRPTTGVGNIAVNCGAFLNLVSSIDMSIHLGDGLSGLSGNQRRMISSATTTGLAYDLYQDASHSTIFGGTYGAKGGQPLRVAGSSLLNLLSSSGVNIPVYARVPGGQSQVVPGAYSSSFSRNPADVRVDYRTCNLLMVCTLRTGTFSFNVRAQVLPECRVQADLLDFGTHGILSQPINATSQVRLTCTSGTSYNVGLGYGLAGIGLANRQMKDLAGNRIGYQLYRDNARTNRWGLSLDGLGLIGAGTGAMRSIAVYGQVPPQPTPPPGTYSDTVVVSVTY